jgi:hypothetical protein
MQYGSFRLCRSESFSGAELLFAAAFLSTNCVLRAACGHLVEALWSRSLREQRRHHVSSIATRVRAIIQAIISDRATLRSSAHLQRELLNAKCASLDA